MDRPDQPLLLFRVLLDDDAAKVVFPLTVIPDHVQHPFRAVLFMVHRWIEAAAVQIDWLRPRAADILRGNQVVMRVLEGSHMGFDIGIY
ncbi:hypothetical protein D3C77_532340 [compost metagenome]